MYKFLKSNSIIIAAITLIILVVGYLFLKETPVKTVKNYLALHYTVTANDCDIYNKEKASMADHMYDNKEIIAQEKSIQNLMTTDAFEKYSMNTSLRETIKGPALGNFTTEIKNLKVSEGEKSGDDRIFNASFLWIANDENGNVKREEKMDLQLRLSEENGKWKINNNNQYYYLTKDLIIAWY
ncbi:MAG: hypothetical protein RR636_06380 [Clostridium sp.]|uniref:hypothetical protein n=1 Tax=Clostridium sp. TaxID=1506 RepID=UPI00305733F2